MTDATDRERLNGKIRLGIAACGHGEVPQTDRREAHAALDSLLSRLEAAEADKQLLREERNLYRGDRDEARSLLAAAEADARQKEAALERIERETQDHPGLGLLTSIARAGLAGQSVEDYVAWVAGRSVGLVAEGEKE